MTTLYGKTDAEKLAEEKTIVRQIVTEINRFGISDKQRWLLLYSISLELENFEDSREIAEILKVKRPELFLTPKSEPEDA